MRKIKIISLQSTLHYLSGSPPPGCTVEAEEAEVHLEAFRGGGAEDFEIPLPGSLELMGKGWWQGQAASGTGLERCPLPSIISQPHKWLWQGSMQNKEQLSQALLSSSR